jgi:hypothetical protein
VAKKNVVVEALRKIQVGRISPPSLMDVLVIFFKFLNNKNPKAITKQKYKK